MLLLGSVASTICDDDDVEVRSGHKAINRQRTTISYMHKGYHVCRNTFTFLHGVSKHKVNAIKKHFLENGISTKVHGNIGNQPKHALTLKIILGILQFILNYPEQHAILLPGHIPGFKRDDVKVLPSSDTWMVLYYIHRVFNLLNFIHANVYSKCYCNSVHCIRTMNHAITQYTHVMIPLKHDIGKLDWPPIYHNLHC